MPRFRCYKCTDSQGRVGREFSTEDPDGPCPGCNSKAPPVVLPLCDQHWHAQGEDGRFFVACMPKRPTVAGLIATGDMLAVTCPNCRQTDFYKDRFGKWAEEWPDVAKAHLQRHPLET